MTGDDTEVCPFCAGTGRRLVPPPMSHRGGIQAKDDNGTRIKGPRHGYSSTYMRGCRCDLCRAAHRQYRAAQRDRAKAAS